MSNSKTKCCMANYCRYSSDNKYCIADDETLTDCPYLEAIGEIARLSIKLIDKE